MMQSDRNMLPVVGTVAVCTLPHFANVSLWVIFVCFLLWIYPFLRRRYTWPGPGWKTLQIFAAIFFICTFLTHEGITVEAFVALLTLMIGLKLLEIRVQRDRIITVILCYFLIVSVMFFSDSIVVTVYMLFSVLYTTAVLIHINHPGQPIIKTFKLSASLIVQALPLMLVLFLLFPRFPGSLWGRSAISSAKTGFTDRLEFGNIAELARSNEIAFRVEFDGNIPSINQLYWRGIVLWQFDGKAWRRGIERHEAPVQNIPDSKHTTYTITLEPHNERWLILLDLPLQVNVRRTKLLNDFTAYRRIPVAQRIVYSAESVLDTHAPVFQGLKGPALQLPANINPRARALAATLANESSNTEEYVQRVLTYFQEQPFLYTLTPPPLLTRAEENSGETAHLVDRFLFESRKGFCEHYASAFAFLMRTANIPARIVLGYFGGTVNKFGNYLIVRQSDAHAWCEIWLPEKGWVRVDPTTAVAPARGRGNVASIFPASERADLFSFIQKLKTSKLFESIFNLWDALNNRWNRLVMGYSAAEQQTLFSSLNVNMAEWKGPVKLLAIVVTVVLVIIIISMFVFTRQSAVSDEIADAWNEFCKKLGMAGLPRRPEQGPVDYMEHVILLRPDLQDQVKKTTRLYISLRYGKDAVRHNTVTIFKNMIKRFKPRKNPQSL